MISITFQIDYVAEKKGVSMGATVDRRGASPTEEHIADLLNEAVSAAMVFIARNGKEAQMISGGASIEKYVQARMEKVGLDFEGSALAAAIKQKKGE